MLPEPSPEMGKVVGLLKELSMDEQVQMMVEAREKARTWFAKRASLLY
jgi:hypothetical protein